MKFQTANFTFCVTFSLPMSSSLLISSLLFLRSPRVALRKEERPSHHLLARLYFSGFHFRDFKRQLWKRSLQLKLYRQRMARRQQNRAAQDCAVGRKILDRADKSVTSCNVDSPETKWCDSFSQWKGGKLYLAPMCSFVGCTRRLNLSVVRFYCLFT